MKSCILGYPRIGENRELKKAVESYWKRSISIDELFQAGKDVRVSNWKKQQLAGMDFIPSNDFSFYDSMLDMSCLLGNIPNRFNASCKGINNLDIAFQMARGSLDGAPACEMTKWFDTNYHFIVPEFYKSSQYKISSEKIFDEYKDASDIGVETRPVLIGLLTYVALGKVYDKGLMKYDVMDQLLPVYIDILKRLVAIGVKHVQIDEPVYTLDLSEEFKKKGQEIYLAIMEAVSGLSITVTSYFSPLCSNLQNFFNLPIAGLHFDLIYGRKDLDALLKNYPSEKFLSIGIVDGRNIWKNNLSESVEIVKQCMDVIDQDKLIISSSCSLLHVPITLNNEPQMVADIKDWLSFADEKLSEITAIKLISSGISQDTYLKKNISSLHSRKVSDKINNAKVSQRLKAITEADFHRNSSFKTRKSLQKDILCLPLYPTTTIGSFPQTVEVRSMRKKFKEASISQAKYDDFIAQQIRQAIKFQDDVGLDMYVHGEFERNDMVEYFGELLEGVIFSKNGWVQSYGSRCTKPPIIFGDVYRKCSMTVRWTDYAQKHSKKPVKGMLTGPVTILQWSFVRNDQELSKTAYQIALAIMDEVIDLEKCGIKAIQIDEPALREGLPLRKDLRDEYLKWSVHAFKLASSSVKDITQIHTHMCYAEFNDIIDSITDLDADVISIEASRSNMELLSAFTDFNYPNDIGPGVYDIHSYTIPSKDSIVDLLKKVSDVIPVQNIWVNPDCGLKTRGWDEVKPSLKNIVDAAQELRSSAID